jgi:hypothetical protein
MIAMFVGIGVSLLSIVAFSVWWRATQREVISPLPSFIRRHYSVADAVLPQGIRQQQRGDGGDDGLEKKPVIFDARTGRQMMDVLTWEGSVVSFRLRLSCLMVADGMRAPVWPERGLL